MWNVYREEGRETHNAACSFFDEGVSLIVDEGSDMAVNTNVTRRPSRHPFPSKAESRPRCPAKARPVGQS